MEVFRDRDEGLAVAFSEVTGENRRLHSEPDHERNGDFSPTTGRTCLRLIGNMTLEETNCFKMLDEYARSRHRCFLAEMNLSADKTHYALCFRPTGGNKDSPNRYACRYLHIGAEQVGTAGHSLPPSIVEMLDRELPILPQS